MVATKEKSRDRMIMDKYPLLYAGRDLSTRHSLLPFGFECGQGWYGILENLSQKLENLISEYISENPSDTHPQAIQVKSKFGTLRFYMNFQTEQMRKVIADAEKSCATTCEHCGSVATHRLNGWITYVCEDCAVKSGDTYTKI